MRKMDVTPDPASDQRRGFDVGGVNHVPETVPIYLNSQDVRSGLSFQDCIPLMRLAMIQISTSPLRQPLRDVLALDEERFFGSMPGAIDEGRFFGAKLVSVFNDRSSEGRQRHQGVVALFEGRTGAPVCFADAEEITRIRTAAATVVATQALARPDAKVLGVLGAGLQAEAHIVALTLARPYERILIWSRNADRAQALAKRTARLFDIEVCKTVQDVAQRAEVICTLTASSTPVLNADWIGPGAHVNAIGSSVAWALEVDPRLVARGRFVVESRTTAQIQAAEYIRAREDRLVDDDHIAIELGEVLAGLELGRRSNDEITIYKSLGHIAQDLMATKHLYCTHYMYKDK